ncbi:hypothetical protein CsSME_00013086 [Camellia sinensis var. sinensis]
MSFGAAVIYHNKQVWVQLWIFWVGPFVGAMAAAAYHQYLLSATAIKALGSFRSNPTNPFIFFFSFGFPTHESTCCFCEESANLASTFLSLTFFFFQTHSSFFFHHMLPFLFFFLFFFSLSNPLFFF